MTYASFNIFVLAHSDVHPHRTKLKLFTSFDKQLETHDSVLDNRAKVLEGVKSKLVAQSGNILA